MQEEPKNNSGNKRGESGGKQETTQQSGSTKNERFQALAPEEYVTILERVSDGFVAFDAQMNYTYVNQRAGELLGRKPEHLIGKNYWVEYPEARGTPFADAYVCALETLEPIVFEDYYEPFDRWFENRIYPSKDGLVVLFTEVTEKKKAELNLREAQERLALAIRSANIGLWDWDLLTNKVYYSPEWKSQLGYQDHEISNEFSEWENRVHSEDAERAKETVRGYIERPYPDFRNEFRLRHKDGSHRWILAQASLLYDEGGKPVRMIGSHFDISERKQAEILIRRERDFSEAVLNSLPGVFYMYDEDRKFLRWNNNFETVTGYSSEEIAQMNPLDFFAGNEKDLLAARIQEVFETGESHVEADFVSKNGTRSPYYFTGRTIEVEGKTCLVGVGIDSTQRKLYEQAVQRNEQVLRLFVEHSPAAIAMFDHDMKYIVASHRYLSDYELGDQDIVGCSHYDVFPEIPDRWKEIHRHCLAGATERVEEDPFPRKDGRMDWVRWEIRPWYEKEGEIGGVILFSEVITERKRAEEELRLSRNRLAELSRRLVEVHETEQRTIGRELHDQIGQMLTALKLTLEIAPRLPPEQGAKKFAQAQELVNELLERISNLSLELRPPMLDDLGLVPALLWHFNRYQEQSGIQVHFKHSGVEGVRFDSKVETTAYRIVQEALTNIARHARATLVRLEVRTGGGQMEIQIGDDGKGFDVEAALAKNRGLSGMRERISLLGGTFQIESQIGQGTRKWIKLPLMEDKS